MSFAISSVKSIGVYSENAPAYVDIEEGQYIFEGDSQENIASPTEWVSFVTWAALKSSYVTLSDAISNSGPITDTGAQWTQTDIMVVAA